ncbi:MAG: hypothetical protein EA392_04155 [Cryomorphaceae bacterium]|nr:MAG: hypothetical protein EA392_04155 [Cryomorphaceae bacterium]
MVFEGFHFVIGKGSAKHASYLAVNKIIQTKTNQNESILYKVSGSYRSVVQYFGIVGFGLYNNSQNYLNEDV